VKEHAVGSLQYGPRPACVSAPWARPTVNIFGYNISEFGLGIAFVMIAIIVLLIVIRRL
jgi:hypothetical protein